MRFSLALTISNKLNLNSLPKVFAKFGRELSIPGSDGKILASFPDVSLKKPRKFKVTNYNPLLRLERLSHITFRTIDTLGAVCSLCGSSSDVEMHHVRKLRSVTDRVKQDYYLNMRAQMNRKQIPVCRECHLVIHGKKDNLN